MDAAMGRLPSYKESQYKHILYVHYKADTRSSRNPGV